MDKNITRVNREDIDNKTTNNVKVIKRVVKVIPKDQLDKVDLEKEAALREEEIRHQKLLAEQKRIKEEQRKKEIEEFEKRKREIELKKIEEEKARQEAEARRKQLARIEAEKQMKLKEERELKKKKIQEKELKKKQKQEEKINKKTEKLNNKQKNKKEYKKSKKKKNNDSKIIRTIKIIFFTGFFTCIAGCSVIFLVLFSWCQDLPEININELKQISKTSYVYDINGDLITTYSGTENRKWVSIDEIPDELLTAFVTVEDKRFYSHNGVDFKRFVSAVVGQLTNAGDHGGSTITQQLIKNVYLSNEITYKRKMQEIILALKLEKQMTKEEILESYVNIIYFGSSNYGVASAAEDYFGKELDELTLREMAMLAGIPKNPNGYNPRRNTYVKKDMTKTNERTDDVLWVMKENKKISEEQYKKALSEKVEIKEESHFFEMYDYAHAVEYAMSDAVNDMIEQRGLENTYANRIMIDNEIRQGGYTIYTTIDPDIQESVQNTVSNYEDYPRIYNAEGKFIEENGIYEKPQVASVVIDPKTGHILAMIGSRDNVTSMKTFNRAISNNMPVASTIKPLSIYAPCIEKGLQPSSVEYNYSSYIEGYDPVSPYPGGESPEKAVTMREAVQKSYNISAARFLCRNLGYDLSEAYLLNLGISKSSIQKNGAGLALGTSGINMLELTSAYQSLANGGWYYEPKSYTKVVDINGNIVLNADDYQIKRKVFNEETAWLMTDILKTTIEKGTAYKAMLNGVEAAGKTGTHEDKCSVFAGYTHDYVSCVWIGSDSFSDLEEASGSKVAAPIWKNYMNSIYEKKGVSNELIYESKPKNIEEIEFCSLSGKVATNHCTETFKDYANVNNLEECNLHVNVKTCAFSGKLVGEQCPDYAITESNKLFFPLGSSIASLSDEIISKYYPNAFVESPDSVCVSHVNGNTIPSDDQIQYMRSQLAVINELKQNILIPVEYINILNLDYASASNYIARAEKALSGSKESSGFYNEYFAEYDRIKTDIQTVQNFLNATMIYQ